jgi:hypothetical protein
MVRFHCVTRERAQHINRKDKKNIWQYISYESKLIFKRH